jgi:hypothetical protein
MVAWVAVAHAGCAALSLRSSTQRFAWGAGLVLVQLLAGAAHARALLPGYGVDRSRELALGNRLRQVAHSGQVLVEPVDYGYFAIEAALGAPDRIVLARSLDPRQAPKPSSLSDPLALARRVRTDGIQWIVVKADSPELPRALAFGTQIEAVGDWCVVSVRRTEPAQP